MDVGGKEDMFFLFRMSLSIIPHRIHGTDIYIPTFTIKINYTTWKVDGRTPTTKPPFVAPSTFTTVYINVDIYTSPMDPSWDLYNGVPLLALDPLIRLTHRVKGTKGQRPSMG